MIINIENMFGTLTPVNQTMIKITTDNEPENFNITYTYTTDKGEQTTVVNNVAPIETSLDESSGNYMSYLYKEDVDETTSKFNRIWLR